MNRTQNGDKRSSPRMFVFDESGIMRQFGIARNENAADTAQHEFTKTNHIELRYAMKTTLLLLLSLTLLNASALAQHEHDTKSSQIPNKASKAPTIFLEKSARVVEYQLQRLSTEQLLLVDTKTDDKKYLPVFNAILTREGMSRAYRDDALAGMVAINGSDAVTELLASMSSIRKSDAASTRTINALAMMLLDQPSTVMREAVEQLVELATSGNPLTAPVGYAALLTSNEVERAWGIAKSNDEQTRLLDAIPMIPSAQVRSSLHARVLELTSSANKDIQNAAVRALASIPSGQAETFIRVADLVSIAETRIAAVKTLLSVPPSLRDAAKSTEIISWLVNFAESTPAAQRTEDSFLDAMELVEQLLAQAPTDLAKAIRSRLRETVVRVVRIHTVEEEMRYDVPFFAVEAGRPVQVVLINEDIMPHNLVLTMPGTLQEVAEAGGILGPEGGLDGKQYVPHSDKVLFATDMIATRTQQSLTFDAPMESGEYPYVCTFPRHWMRMYGVMVVVDDLDEWLKNPVEPRDPIGSNRRFVQSWTVDDLASDLANSLRGRSPEIGERMFVEATCAQCHKAGPVGVGNVGPELSETFAKFKGDTKAVLREILDPSHRIDDKYAVHLVLDVDGKTVSGLVLEDDKEKLVILENPEAKQPTVIQKDNIEQMVKTSNSMMPKGLMDRFSKDEIFELLGFLQSIQK